MQDGRAWHGHLILLYIGGMRRVALSGARFPAAWLAPQHAGVCCCWRESAGAAAVSKHRGSRARHCTPFPLRRRRLLDSGRSVPSRRARRRRACRRPCGAARTRARPWSRRPPTAAPVSITTRSRWRLGSAAMRAARMAQRCAAAPGAGAAARARATPSCRGSASARRRAGGAAAAAWRCCSARCWARRPCWSPARASACPPAQVRSATSRQTRPPPRLRADRRGPQACGRPVRRGAPARRGRQAGQQARGPPCKAAGAALCRPGPPTSAPTPSAPRARGRRPARARQCAARPGRRGGRRRRRRRY